MQRVAARKVAAEQGGKLLCIGGSIVFPGDEVRGIAAAALEKCLEGSRTDWMELKNAVKDALGKYLYQKTHRKPMILPVIMDV